MINCLKTVFISHSNADKLTKHKQYLMCLYHRPIQQQTKTFMAEQRTGKATLLHLLFQRRKKTFPFLMLLFIITQQPQNTQTFVICTTIQQMKRKKTYVNTNIVPLFILLSLFIDKIQ